MFLVGIMGAKGAGKDTVADAICGPTGGIKLSMATPFKNMLVALGVPPEAIEDREAKEAPSPELCGATIRWGMQSLGTEWGRACIHPDLWCSRVEALIAEHWRANPHIPVVIPDIRFPNEVEMIRRNGGILLKVRRPSVEPSFTWVDRLLRFLRIRKPLHPSEAYWRVAPCHVEIVNDGERFELETKVSAVTATLPAHLCAVAKKGCSNGS